MTIIPQGANASTLNNTPAIVIDYQEILDQLGGGRVVAYKPFLAHACGGATVGLLLSQFWYYSNMETSQAREGWFYKSQSEITEETGLSRTETEVARKKLISTGILSEDLRGIPARMWYRLNKDRLYEILQMYITPGEELTGASSQEVTERLIAIYKYKLKKLGELAFKRSVKLGVKAEPVDYEEIMRRDCGLCHICGGTITQGPGQKKGDLQFDHVQALNTGGSHTPENVKVAHSGCNYEKGDKSLPLGVKKPSLRDSRKLEKATQGNKPVRVAQAITKTSLRIPEKTLKAASAAPEVPLTLSEEDKEPDAAPRLPWLSLTPEQREPWATLALAEMQKTCGGVPVNPQVVQTRAKTLYLMAGKSGG